MKDTLLLIDGNNLAYRCKFVFNLTNKGIDVSVVYGFLRTLESLIKKNNPSSVIVAWDGRVPKYRKTLVPEYKANRHHSDDPDERADFIRQMDELHTYALPRMGIVSIRRPYIEADDLLYHASIISSHEENIIVTGDKDLLQALSNRTKVYSPNKDIYYDVSKFEKEFGITVSQYVWWKSLQGDGSDNVPGVPGVGAVTATKLLNKFVDIDKLFYEISCGNFSTKISQAINEFGYDKLHNNYKVMSLDLDRFGARYSLSNELKYYKRAEKHLVKEYILRSAFISLLDSFPKLVADLDVPRFDNRMRYPVVIDERRFF